MSDEERSDFAIPPGKPTSLPPAAKTWAVAGYEVKGVVTLVVALLGCKWGFVPKELLCGLLVGLPMADYARRKAQGALDLPGILAMIDRMRR